MVIVGPPDPPLDVDTLTAVPKVAPSFPECTKKISPSSAHAMETLAPLTATNQSREGVRLDERLLATPKLAPSSMEAR